MRTQTKYNLDQWTKLLSAILVMIALLTAGCSHNSTSTSTSGPPFSGTRFSTYQDGSEKLILNVDGSYKQFIQTKTHRTLTNISHWTPGQPPANSTDTGRWFILHDYVAPWDWVKSKPNAAIQRSTMLISTDGFNGVTRPLPPVVTANTDTNGAYQPIGTSAAPHRHRLSQNAYDAVLLIGIFFTFIWVLAIVGAAQRGQIIWLVIIVLFPCTSFIYGILHMMTPRNRGY